MPPSQVSEALTSGLRSTADAAAVNSLVMTTPGFLVPRRVLIVAQMPAAEPVPVVAQSDERPAVAPVPVAALSGVTLAAALAPVAARWAAMLVADWRCRVTRFWLLPAVRLRCADCSRDPDWFVRRNSIGAHSGRSVFAGWSCCRDSSRCYG